MNRSIRKLFDAMEFLVDDRVGIIREVREKPKEAGAPDLFYYRAAACEPRALCGQQNSGVPGGGGASGDRETAMAKAIGEAVERYCANMYDFNDFPLTAFESAPFPCVEPEEFALYSKQQYAQPDFPYVPFDTSTPVRWTAALDVMTGKICYVPAVMVFLSYFYGKDASEKPIAQSTSTGLACHVDPVRAAISAICEVIERDAFTITWQARLARSKICNDTLSDSTKDLVRRFEYTGGRVTLFDMAMDHGVPAILAVLRNSSSELPAFVFAAAADLDPEVAIKKSLEELAHTYRYARWIKSHFSRLDPQPDYENVVSLHDHGNVYCDHKNAHLADFLFSSNQQIRFDEHVKMGTGDAQSDLQAITMRVAACGHRVLLADVTTEDIRDLGLSVIRAMIPGFHPLFFGHRIRALGGRRLWEVPRNLGYPGITGESGDNPAPHPFP